MHACKGQFTESVFLKKSENPSATKLGAVICGSYYTVRSDFGKYAGYNFPEQIMEL